MAKRVILSVGTKRGLFLLESGTGRKRWKVTGPLLKGWAVPYACVDTRGAPRLHAPLLHLDKAAIVLRGLELGAPLHLSWSCYQGEAEACGECESCRLRLRGFERAGARDPIPYAT